MLVEISALIQQYFLAIWLAVLVVLIGAVFLHWPSVAPAPRPASSRLSGPDVAALVALAILFAWCAFVMLYRVDLADHDHSQLTRAIVGHRSISFPIWPRSGRFFPFGGQEFELLRRLGAPALGYFILPALELAVFCGALLLLLRRLPIPVRVIAAGLLLVAPSTQLIFHGLVYSERNVLLLLVLMALGLQSHDRVPSRRAVLGTLAAVHFALYYKEPVFVLVAAIAATRLLVDWAALERPRNIREFLASHRLELGMFGLVLVFISLYALTMLPYRSMEYAQSYANRGTRFGTLFWYLRAYPILPVFLVAMVARGIAIARRRVVPDRLWEPLAAGAVVYFAVYVVLGMQSAYFMAPVDLIGVIYTTVAAYEAVTARSVRPLVPAVAAAALGGIMFMSTWYLLIARKNAIASTATLAEFVKGVADTSRTPVRVFMPLQTNYAMMEFGSLLEYKGARVVADSGARAGEVVLYASAETPDGRCVSFSRVPCAQASMAPQGTLVLTMANDWPPAGSSQSLRPSHPAVAIPPFGIPAIVSALRAVRTMLGQPDPGPRQDWLWAYAVIATEKADHP
jgi:hypothetical protein